MQNNFFCFILVCVLYHPPCFRLIRLQNSYVLLPPFFLSIMRESRLSFSVVFCSPPRKTVYDCTHCPPFLKCVSPPVCFLLCFSHCYDCVPCSYLRLRHHSHDPLSYPFFFVCASFRLYKHFSSALVAVSHRACIFSFFCLSLDLPFPFSIIIALISCCVFSFATQLIDFRTHPSSLSRFASCFSVSLFGDSIYIAYLNFFFLGLRELSVSRRPVVHLMLQVPTLFHPPFLVPLFAFVLTLPRTSVTPLVAFVMLPSSLLRSFVLLSLIFGQLIFIVMFTPPLFRPSQADFVPCRAVVYLIHRLLCLF